MSELTKDLEAKLHRIDEMEKTRDELLADVQGYSLEAQLQRNEIEVDHEFRVYLHEWAEERGTVKDPYAYYYVQAAKNAAITKANQETIATRLDIEIKQNREFRKNTWWILIIISIMVGMTLGKIQGWY